MKERTDAAIMISWAFKPEAMRRMLVRVLTLAFKLPKFSAMDLPEHGAEAHGGSGIAGCVIKQLKDEGVLSVVGVFNDGKFYAETIINNGGNPIKVYRLANGGLARALLKVHAPLFVHELKQMEFCSRETFSRREEEPRMRFAATTKEPTPEFCSRETFSRREEEPRMRFAATTKEPTPEFCSREASSRREEEGVTA
jgi:hypothetical protein